MTRDVTIRRAIAADGEALLLEVGGEPWAAYSFASGRTIGDAFRRTLRLRSLLRDFAFA